jgi:hypothetical protein
MYVPARVQRLVAAYVNALGLAQRWDMFAAPQRESDYLRIRYYVTSATREAPDPNAWVLTQLIFPVSREDRVRIVGSMDSFARDRTFAWFLERVHASHASPPQAADDEAFEQALAPAVNYLRREFERGALSADERVARVEIWHATLPSPAPGAADARNEGVSSTIRGYYAAPKRQPWINTRASRLFGVEFEQDLQWRLEYIDEP